MGTERNRVTGRKDTLGRVVKDSGKTAAGVVDRSG